MSRRWCLTKYLSHDYTNEDLKYAHAIIRRTEQGQLPTGCATITLRPQRVVRRRVSPKQFVWPIPGQSLDNRNRFNENSTYAVQRTTYSESFWDP